MPAVDLPIESIRSELYRVLREGRRFVLEAPTGSGKSTQVPQMLIDGGFAGKTGVIWMLQPRRIAARMLAKRIAWERNTALGTEIGYQIRFDRVANDQTRVLLVTEGILLRKMLGDPTMKGIDAILFDEFHERNLYSDLSLAKAFELQKQHRPDLIIGVMSATLDGDRLEHYLQPCARLRCEGRTYPVDISYASAMGLKLSREMPIWDIAAAAFRQSVRAGNTGHHLLFMPGAFEIHRTLRALESIPEARRFELHALHGELSAEAQDNAIAATAVSGKSKVIVSTNVAETSLTIPGVEVVIDSGLARIPRYDPHRGVNTILVQPISQASADQRAGRAGREGPGTCIRLWSQHQHHQRVPFEVPEIRRVDLSETLLMLKASPSIDLQTFRWFEEPSPEQLDHAFTLLKDLGALHPKTGTITALGRKLSAFPIHPRYSRLFVEASANGCMQLAAAIAALSQDRSILLPLNHKRDAEVREETLTDEETTDSDVLMELKAFIMAANQRFDLEYCRKLGIHAGAARTAARMTEQFLGIAQKQGLEIEPAIRSDWYAIRRCIFIAFSDFLAKRLDKGTLRCALAHGKKATRRRESLVDSEWLVSTEIEERNVQGSVQVMLGRNASVDPSWIEEVFPEEIEESGGVVWDPWQKRVRKTRQKVFRSIVMEEKESTDISPTEAASLIAAQVLAGELKIKAWNAKAEALIERINFLAQHFPEYEVSPITENDRITLLEQICYGAITEKDLHTLDVLPAIMDWMSAEQACMLDTCAPESIQTENRGRLKIRYEKGRAILSARIQQLYDLEPILVARRVPVVYEMLAPNQRPVQITEDLNAFWTTSYPMIKKDLKGRYPKHEWR